MQNVKHKTKNLLPILFMVCVALTLMSTTALAAPGDYNTGDIAVINDIIDNNNLSWTKASPADGSYAPSDWVGVIWSSDATNKRIAELYIRSSNLEGDLDVSGLSALKQLECGRNDLTSLDVSSLDNLKVLYCDVNNLTSLDVSDLTALEILGCFNNNLTSLNVSGLSALEYLACSSNNLTSLNVSGLSALWYLDVHNNFMANENAVINVTDATAFVGWDTGDYFYFSPQYLGIGQTLDLGEGYSIIVQQIDISGNKAYLQFLYNGQVIDSGIVNTNINVANIFGVGQTIDFDNYSIIVQQVDSSGNKAYIQFLYNGQVIDSCIVNTNAYLSIGQTLDLGEGYSIIVQQVDASGKKAYIQFLYNGQVIDSGLFSTNVAMQDGKVWEVTMDLPDGTEVQVLRVHLVNIQSDRVGIQDIFIDYKNIIHAEKMGQFVFNDKYILGAGQTLDLGGGYLITVQQINADGQAYVQFLYNGQVVDSGIAHENINISKILGVGQTLNFGENYSIIVQQVDESDNKVYIEVLFDGQVVGSGIVNTNVALGVDEMLDLGGDYSISVRLISLSGTTAIIQLLYDGQSIIVGDETINHSVVDSNTAILDGKTWEVTLGLPDGTEAQVLRVNFNYIQSDRVEIQGIWLADYKNAIDAEKTGKLIFDNSNNRYILGAGQTLDLGEGYSITVQQINADGTKAYIQFLYNGQVLDSGIVNTNINLANILGLGEMLDFGNYSIIVQQVDESGNKVYIEVLYDDQVIDSCIVNTNVALGLGQALDFGEGYSIIIQQIDASGKKAYIQFLHNGQLIDACIISRNAAIQNSNPWEVTMDLPDGTEVQVLRVRFNNIQSDRVEIQGIWLMDYKNVNHVEKMGKLVFGDSDDRYILGAGQTLDLGEGYLITVQQINRDKAYIQFLYNDQVIDSGIVRTDINVSNILGLGQTLGFENYSIIVQQIDSSGNRVYIEILYDGQVINSCIVNTNVALGLDQALDFGEGYSIIVQQIDVSGKKAYIQFLHNGQLIDACIVSRDAAIQDGKTWETKNFFDGTEAQVLRVHFNRIQLDRVEIQGIWFADDYISSGIYNADDIAVINAIIDNNNLSWTKASPAGSYVPADWTGVTWSSDAADKRIVELNISNSSLDGALDVTGLTALEYLDASSGTYKDSMPGNNLTSLNVSGLNALSYLNCGYNNLISLDVSGCNALVTLYCFDNNLTSLDVSDCTALEKLVCDVNNLTSLDLSGLNALEHLSCNTNNLTSLDVSDLNALEHLSCNFNNLTSLNVSGCTALEYLSCDKNNLTSLDVSGLFALEVLNCNLNNLTSLNIAGCTALKSLSSSSNDLTSLNVSGCTALSYLNVRYNFMENENAVTNVTDAATFVAWGTDNFYFSPQKSKTSGGSTVTITFDPAPTSDPSQESGGGSTVTITFGPDPTSDPSPEIALPIINNIPLLLELDRTAATLKAGETIQFITATTLEDDANKNLTWSSSDPSVVSVDANGKVTAHKDGTATITATNNDDGSTASSAVTVAGSLEGENNSTPGFFIMTKIRGLIRGISDIFSGIMGE